MFVNMHYVMHMTRGSQKLKQEKHMFCLLKPDSPIWQTGTSGFLSTTRKTETSGLENWTIRFFQTDHIDKKTFIIAFQSFNNTYKT
jgi:hypothetical protein